jgi:hypothetical protein
MIDLHDSHVADIRCSGRGITIRFAHAYMHRSDGRPGVDAGTGWSQEAELHISGATLIGKVPPLPCLLIGGTLAVGGYSHENMIPLPLHSEEPSMITLWFGYDDFGIEAKGRSSRLQLIGEARYVEDFYPTEKFKEP